VLRAAESIRRDQGSFSKATPAAVHLRTDRLGVVAGDVQSISDQQISMAVTSAGDGWFGAVRSRSGRCYLAATLDTVPVELTLTLPSNANCTGNAARDVLGQLPTTPSSMTSVAPVGAGSGSG
jgi:hypothetical protein